MVLGSGCRLEHLDFSLHDLTLSNKLNVAFHSKVVLDSKKEKTGLISSRLGRHTPTLPAAFRWSQKSIEPAQIPGEGNGVYFLMGSGAASLCTEACRE